MVVGHRLLSPLKESGEFCILVFPHSCSNNVCVCACLRMSYLSCKTFASHTLCPFCRMPPPATDPSTAHWFGDFRNYPFHFAAQSNARYGWLHQIWCGRNAQHTTQTLCCQTELASLCLYLPVSLCSTFVRHKIHSPHCIWLCGGSFKITELTSNGTLDSGSTQRIQ